MIKLLISGWWLKIGPAGPILANFSAKIGSAGQVLGVPILA